MVPIMFSRVWAGEVWGCFVSTFAPFYIGIQVIWQGRCRITPSVIAARCHRSPFCHLRDIFPRPGEVFLNEGGIGKIRNSIILPKAPSPRELARREP